MRATTVVLRRLSRFGAFVRGAATARGARGARTLGAVAALLCFAPVDTPRAAVSEDGTALSFVQPHAIDVRVNERKPERSSVRSKGVFDTGPDAIEVAGDIIVAVGGLELAGTLEPGRRGSLLLRDGRSRLKLRPSKHGSSRVTYRLKVRGDLQGAVPTDGDLTLRIVLGSADGSGTATVRRGRYRISQNGRGRLVAPSLSPLSIVQRHGSSSGDRIAASFAFPGLGELPEVAEDVSVNLGDFAATVPASEFFPLRNGFAARSPASAPGINWILVDYRGEHVLVLASDLHLGELPAAGRYDSRITVGSQTGKVAVRLAPERGVYHY